MWGWNPLPSTAYETEWRNAHPDDVRLEMSFVTIIYFEKFLGLCVWNGRPDMVDSALLRPGRLDKLLYVPLPDPAGRASILDTLVRRVPLAGDVDVPSIGMSQHCEGFSGADLGALVRPLCASHSGRPSAQQLFQVLSQVLALLWFNI